jgi:hypothetical protein
METVKRNQPNTPDEAAAVVKAFLNGEAVEYTATENKAGEGYCDLDKGDKFWFEEFRYRIKRSPRRFWLNVYPDDADPQIHSSLADANDNAAPNRVECIELLEVR